MEQSVVKSDAVLLECFQGSYCAVKEPTETLIRYRLERAQEALGEVKLLAEGEYWNTCTNRLYYACFYVVNALLLAHGLSSSKHSGVRSAFNHRFVKSGIVPKEFGRLYNDLYENRQESDYQDLVRMNHERVNAWFPQVEKFVEAITKLVQPE